MAGFGTVGGTELVCFKVRAVSDCYFQAGPTRDRDCVDAARCDWFCP